MQSKDQVNRRQFMKLAAGSAVVVPFFAALPAGAGGHLPKLEESDPQAVGLGYKHNTADVDKDKHVNHTEEQLCSNCQLYQGKEGNDWGPCAIFPGKEVSATGWCSAYVVKA